ncbi:MAG: hypothetical protein ABFC38_10690 [Methanospirillum sp.]
MKPAVAGAERRQARAGDRFSVPLGHGASLVQREEERERFEGAELAGKAPAVRLADSPVKRGQGVAEPVRAGEARASGRTRPSDIRCVSRISARTQREISSG